ncbi:MAG: DUF2634 domain-containing protein [Firmicutes bacterium]|nr:DUF2634 domain-containing protein [Bacillota bacterium]
MIPKASGYEPEDELVRDFEEEGLADRTYRLNFQGNCIGGKIDQMEARKQAILKRIMTEAEAYPIYDETYGCLMADFIGAQPSDARAQVKDRLREGILEDDRFASVDFTKESFQQGKLWLSLTVVCDDGMNIELKEVEIGV